VNRRFPRAARLLWAITVVALVDTLSGCVVYHAVAAPVKLAATSVVVAGEAATAVVTTTGKVAVSGVRAVGNVGSGGIDAAAKLTEAGMVTFVDAATGTVVRVPWQQGLTLMSASDAANVSMARRAVDVVRAGKIIYSASRVNGGGASLASGDVVRLGG
jgi:hypothetical protein